MGNCFGCVNYRVSVTEKWCIKDYCAVGMFEPAFLPQRVLDRDDLMYCDEIKGYGDVVPVSK